MTTKNKKYIVNIIDKAGYSQLVFCDAETVEETLSVIRKEFNIHKIKEINIYELKGTYNVETVFVNRDEETNKPVHANFK